MNSDILELVSLEKELFNALFQEFIEDNKKIKFRSFYAKHLRNKTNKKN